ncbi:MAG: hypothetical protein Q4G68_07070 [Planctomycetia bacterium]|nr:hypothetical protein [Planctomycetia bacterium]
MRSMGVFAYAIRVMIWGCFLQVSFPSFLLGAEEAKKEPIWVMSWAGFIFFVALTLFFFAHAFKRPDTALSNAERKQVEDEMVERVEAKKLAAKEAEKEGEDADK